MFLGKNIASISEWQKVCASKWWSPAGKREREGEKERERVSGSSLRHVTVRFPWRQQQCCALRCSFSWAQNRTGSWTEQALLASRALDRRPLFALREVSEWLHWNRRALLIKKECYFFKTCSCSKCLAWFSFHVLDDFARCWWLFHLRSRKDVRIVMRCSTSRVTWRSQPQETLALGRLRTENAPTVRSTELWNDILISFGLLWTRASNLSREWKTWKEFKNWGYRHRKKWKNKTKN